MTYVVGPACIGSMDRSCIEVCPVDCIYETEHMVVIAPGEYIAINAARKATLGGLMSAPPPCPPYEVASLSDIPHTETDDSYGFELAGEWKQLRHYFAMKEFSANAFVATEAGQEITHEHFEEPNDDQSDVGDEELYYIARGHAVVKLDGEKHDAPEGTVVFVGDPFVVRSVTAREAGTTVLAFGTNPGVQFAVSEFETAMGPPPRWSDPGKPRPRT